MPGLVCVTDRTRDPSELADAVAAKTYGSEKSEIIGWSDGKAAIRMVQNTKHEPFAILETDRWVAATWGYPLFQGKPLSLEHFQIATQEHLVDCVAIFVGLLGGQYQMVLVKRGAAEAHCISDKISTHPWYLTAAGTTMLAAPEALSFSALCDHPDWDSSLDPLSIPEFMASGHLWGERTYYSSVQRMGPGRRAQTSDSGWVINQHFYPNYSAPDNSGTRQLYENKLVAAMQADFQDLPEGRGLITLSGGLDSRALVGLARLTEMGVSTVSYTFGTDVLPNSDPDIASRVAKESGFEWDLIRTDGANVVANIPDVIQATGGECDAVCAQDAFLGPSFYNAIAESNDYLLRGDELWGWGDSVHSIDEAFAQCLLFNLSELPHPERLLRQDAYTEYVGWLREQRTRISDLSQYSAKSRFDDFKDELYWGHRESRLIQNMAHYRRCFIPHLAPLMFDRTLDVIQDLPAYYRVRKNLFVSAMHSAFPDLYSIKGEVAARMGLSLERAILQNSELRDLIVDALVDNLPVQLETVFEPNLLKQWVIQTTSSAGTHAVQKERFVYNLLRSVNSQLRKVPVVRAFLLDIAKRSGRLRFPVVASNYVFRLTVLSLALRHYH